MPAFDRFPQDDDDPEPIEAYCVRCRDTIEMEDPHPVWTRKGSPGTRGICPQCGTVVFRMGRTDAHAALKKPTVARAAVADGEGKQKPSRPVRAVSAVYVVYAEKDAPFAHRLANDLTNMGLPTWLPRADQDEIAWASGVHPALEDCTRMLVLLSPAVLDDPAAAEAWEYFRAQKKPIVVAQLAAVPVPDDLRRAPRIDFSGDYRRALRAVVQALAE
ncbi:MAG: hypothetical protein Kow0077_29590 [Anaerolineae bacterium]